MRCIAKAESEYDSDAKAEGPNGPAWGLFQMGTTHFHWCASPACQGRFTDWKCNTEVAVAWLVSLCNSPHHLNRTPADLLPAYWGVCRGENCKLFDCLKKLGVKKEDVLAMKCPKKGDNCPACPKIRPQDVGPNRPREWAWSKCGW